MSNEETSGGSPPVPSRRFDRFTERARAVLTYAQEEATRFNHNYIGTEHLLLGLVRETDGVGARALVALGTDLGTVRAAVVEIIGRGDNPTVGEIGLTPRAKKVIEHAVAEARRLGHMYVGTEHLLLGILLEEKGIGAKVLQDLGVTLDAARTAVLQLLSMSAPGPKSNVVMCRLDDATLASVDSLIEAGIRTTRSDAVSWLVRAGIEANRPLLERIGGTVAEIRRLREEARRLAQQTSEGQPPPASPPPAPSGGSDQPEGPSPSDPVA
jgi:ATP-dependent Clp protease ATP-binding subunit ClpA